MTSDLGWNLALAYSVWCLVNLDLRLSWKCNGQIIKEVQGFQRLWGKVKLTEKSCGKVSWKMFSGKWLGLTVDG